MKYFTAIAQTLLAASFAGLVGFDREHVIPSAVGLVASHLIHSDLIASAGPVWWPAFVLILDIAAALYGAWRLERRTIQPARHSQGETA